MTFSRLKRFSRAQLTPERALAQEQAPSAVATEHDLSSARGERQPLPCPQSRESAGVDEKSRAARKAF